MPLNPRKDSFDERDELYQEHDSELNNKPSELMEIGYLIGIILDYYETTEVVIESGEEWKSGTIHQPKSAVAVPEKLNSEILKLFTHKIIEFQNK